MKKIFSLICLVVIMFFGTSNIVFASTNPVGLIEPEISSNKYTINEEEGHWVYTKTDTNSNTILSNITVTNGSISIEDNVLYVSNVLPLEGNGKGDAEADGDVDESDALKTIQYMATKGTEDQVKINEDFADVNDDDKIDSTDVMLILAYVNSSSTPKEVNVATGTGDVDMDGYITADDARLILQSVADLVKLTEEQIGYADVNEDGTVTAVDARIILQYLLWYSEEIVKEYDIINISSSVYEISGNTITVSSGDFDKNNIDVTNGDIEYNNGVLTLTYNGEEIDEYSVTIKTTQTSPSTESSSKTTEKPADNPSTTDMTIGNIIFIGASLLLIVGYSLKRFKKVKNKA